MVEKLTSPVHDHLKAGLRSIMETATKEGVVTALRAMASRTDRFHVFSQLKIPVLILSGKQDALIPEDKARLMAERLKMGKWISLDDCGHMPMMEQPDQFNAEIRTFLTLVS
jgi:pimeloyl-ACP methyl ester carboxylesterase